MSFTGPIVTMPDSKLVQIADRGILKVQSLTGVPKYRQCTQFKLATQEG